MTSNVIELVPEMIPIKEASKRTGLSYECLRKMCLRGQIVHIRTGNKYLINWRRLCDFLNTATGNTKELEANNYDHF